MPDNGEINVLEMLINIKTDISSIKTQLSGLNKTQEDARLALTLAKENKSEINQMKRLNNWIVTSVVVGIVFPIVVSLVQHYF